jgi:hypothetical protein
VAQVTIIGPNLPGNTQTFHVHAAGCADIKRSRLYHRAQQWTVELASAQEVVYDVYPSGDFDYPPEEWEDYLSEFRIFPCLDSFPTSVEVTT